MIHSVFLFVYFKVSQNGLVIFKLLYDPFSNHPFSLIKKVLQQVSVIFVVCIIYLNVLICNCNLLH